MEDGEGWAAPFWDFVVPIPPAGPRPPPVVFSLRKKNSSKAKVSRSNGLRSPLYRLWELFRSRLSTEMYPLSPVESYLPLPRHGSLDPL